MIGPAQLSLVADITTGYRRRKFYGVVAFTNMGSTTVRTLVFMFCSTLFKEILPSDFYYRFMLGVSAILGLTAVIHILFIRKPRLVDRNRSANLSLDIDRYAVRGSEDSKQSSEMPVKAESKPEQIYEVPMSLRKNCVV